MRTLVEGDQDITNDDVGHRSILPGVRPAHSVTFGGLPLLKLDVSRAPSPAVLSARGISKRDGVDDPRGGAWVESRRVEAESATRHSSRSRWPRDSVT